MKSAVKKVCNVEVKASPEVLSEIRGRVRKLLAASGEKRPSQMAMVNAIRHDFKDISVGTLKNYVACCLLPDTVFNAFLEGRISFTVMLCLAYGVEGEVAEYLMNEFIERGMIVSQLIRAKALVNGRRVDSWPKALDIVTKRLEEPVPEPTSHKKRSARHNGEPAVESYDDLLNDIILSGTKWRNKVRCAIMMASALSERERAASSFAIFNKIFMLRNAILEQFEFVDKTVKDVLDRMDSRGGSPSGFKEVRDDAGCGIQEGGEDGEGGVPSHPEVHAVRPPLPPGPGQKGGEVRS